MAQTTLVGTVVGMQARTAWSMEQLKKVVPSVFATKASMKMGDRYTFIPSLMAVEALAKMGLVPVAGSQRKSQDAATARHMVRFARLADIGKKRSKGDRYVEVVMSNSHNGRSAFKFYFGIFELICGNGLIVATNEFAGMVRRHTGSIADIMQEAEIVLSRTNEVTGCVDKMLKRVLSKPERMKFANDALALRYADPDTGKVVAPITADSLLVPRRTEDEGDNLWKTFNVVQENLLRGGLDGKSAHGRAVRTREVNDVRKVLTFNTSLWSLAAERVAG